MRVRQPGPGGERPPGGRVTRLRAGGSGAPARRPPLHPPGPSQFTAPQRALADPLCLLENCCNISVLLEGDRCAAR